MLPTLHEPSFREAVEDVYCKSTDAYKNFTLRMVIAISMQKLDAQYAGLADSYYLAALPYLESAIKPMNLGTLQCFALMAQYSLVTPTRTASYWVVGLATRLCQELGITEEASIAPVDRKPQFNALEIDMRRRLFWIITSMEFGLAHSLGRPSSLGASSDHINVRFFEAVDDRYITPSGVLLGSPMSNKKLIAIHFFKMRLLQGEIRWKLYLKRRLEPRDDNDTWFQSMAAKLNDWRSAIPKNDEGSGLSEVWFEVRLNTILVFLYRPSPQIPKPSVRAARICFKASASNIKLQRDQLATRSTDLTWIFTQSLFMALNTILWTLSYPEIREEHSLNEVSMYLSMARDGIWLASERWPGVESALELYEYLIDACLKVYAGHKRPSYVLNVPSNTTSPTPSQEITSPPPISSPSTIVSSISSSRNGYNQNHSSPPNYGTSHETHHDNRLSTSPALSAQADCHSHRSLSFTDLLAPPPNSHLAAGYKDHKFDPASCYNQFPSSSHGMQDWSALDPSASGAAYPLSLHDNEYYLGSIGDQYSRYLHAPYVSQQPVQSLSQDQQTELMRTLESNGLYSNKSLLDQSATFFSSHIFEQ